MLDNSNEGYIYIYKCIVGSGSDVVKIGKTKHFHDGFDRLKQHGRTLYYGFVPYTDFTTGFPIATGFRVKDTNIDDAIVKNNFSGRQFSNIEIYNVDYDLAIKELYEVLNSNGQLIELIQDGISAYDFLSTAPEAVTEVKEDTSKAVFESVKNDLLAKYGDELPEKLMILLKNRNDFEENCRSHYASGNYIEFPNNLVLDIHYNKMKRVDILSKLRDLL